MEIEPMDVLGYYEIMRFSENTIGKIVLFLMILNLLLIILGIGLAIAFWGERAGWGYAATAITSLTVYFGLMQRRPWVAPLMLILLSFAFIQVVLLKPSTTSGIAGKFVGIIINLFWFYFFTKKEVRSYFNTKGIWLFGV
ncbi:MAG: hypothetical protein HY473_01775 [Candidatus Sungbacteria bacterium]|uniref:Uncharacterized protein n=1 Tax=Candidatus Sungiibacteriota bacterium TaxID=2750080 RepID=A0A932YYV5_9BACT|nr:hypothetical protein [Candidatus Sungbacteria bacterium]